MGEEPSTNRVKEYYNNSTVRDFLEEEADRGNTKGSKEGISLGERKGELVRRTFPERTNEKGKDRLEFG